MDYKEAWKVRKRQIIIANISWGILGIWVITDYQGIETIIAGVLMWLIGAWITETLLSGLGKHDGSTTSSLLGSIGLSIISGLGATFTGGSIFFVLAFFIAIFKIVVLSAIIAVRFVWLFVAYPFTTVLYFVSSREKAE